MYARISASSFGLPLRVAQPICPPALTTACSFTLIFGRICAHIFAFQSSTTIAVRSPALSISIMSSSSSASGTRTIFTAGLPTFARRPFSATRLS